MAKWKAAKVTWQCRSKGSLKMRLLTKIYYCQHAVSSWTSRVFGAYDRCCRASIHSRAEPELATQSSPSGWRKWWLGVVRFLWQQKRLLFIFDLRRLEFLGSISCRHLAFVWQLLDSRTTLLHVRRGF